MKSNYREGRDVIKELRSAMERDMEVKKWGWIFAYWSSWEERWIWELLRSASFGKDQR